LAAGGVGGVALLALAGCGVFDGRQDIDLGGWVGAEDAYTQQIVPNARWATDELCGDARPCIQAVQADTLTMYRFAEQEDALATAREFAGEAYLSGWIVVRFEPGKLTKEQRWDFATTLDCINVGVTEDGVEC
jgi:hypothetical protein